MIGPVLPSAIYCCTEYSYPLGPKYIYLIQLHAYTSRSQMSIHDFCILT